VLFTHFIPVIKAEFSASLLQSVSHDPLDINQSICGSILNFFKFTFDQFDGNLLAFCLFLSIWIMSWHI